MNDKSKLRAFAARHGMTLAFAAVAGIALIAPELAWAGSAQGLPYEAPLEKFQNSITGPVAMGVCAVGVVVSGAALVWGGDLGDFTKTLLRLVLAVSIIMGGVSFIKTFIGANGAVISVAATDTRALPSHALPATGPAATLVLGR